MPVATIYIVEFPGYVQKAIHALDLLKSNRLVDSKNEKGEVWRPMPAVWEEFDFYTKIEAKELPGVEDGKICIEVSFFLKERRLAEVLLTLPLGLTMESSPDWWKVITVKYLPDMEIKSDFRFSIVPLSDGTRLMTS